MKPGDLGIIPAYAGSTRHSSCHHGPAWDHPRIRGEHAGARAYTPSRPGSSPHTRGALQDPTEPSQENRIIPAYAGSTPSFGRGLSRTPWIIPAYAGSTLLTRGGFGRLADHPRIRGEHSWRLTDAMIEGGSSPHTRGALPTVGFFLRVAGIIPAYAGSTLGNPCNTKDRRRDYTSFPLPVIHPSGGGGS